MDALRVNALQIMARDIESTILHGGHGIAKNPDAGHGVRLSARDAVTIQITLVRDELKSYRWMNVREVLRRLDIREWEFFYQLNTADLVLKKEYPCTVRQPRQDSTIGLFPAALPSELLVTIVRFAGAHNLEAFWPCTKCKPYWYKWACFECQLIYFYNEWSHKHHFGRCGDRCLCCRSARLGPRTREQNKPGCRACEDLWQLKGTCRTMRKLLKSYNGK